MTSISFNQYDLRYGPPGQNGSQNWSQVLEFSYNFSMDIGGVAEISPSGQVVEFANLSQTWGVGCYCVIGDAYGTTYSFNESGPVTLASGDWTPSSFASGGIVQSNTTVGAVDVLMTFVFPNAPTTGGAPLRLGIDLSQWPWAAAADHLGLIIGAFAEPGAILSWDHSAENLTELTSAGYAPLVSLQFAPYANTSGAVGPGTAAISSDATLSPGQADLLLNFTGRVGGYTYLHYDPWSFYNGTYGIGSTTSGGTSSAIGLTDIVAISGGGAGAVLLGVVMVRARRADLRAEMEL
jgi:hypothetical protein